MIELVDFNEIYGADKAAKKGTRRGRKKADTAVAPAAEASVVEEVKSEEAPVAEASAPEVASSEEENQTEA
jgi:large subunit ribosomal protein L17